MSEFRNPLSKKTLCCLSLAEQDVNIITERLVKESDSFCAWMQILIQLPSLRGDMQPCAGHAIAVCLQPTHLL